jgi:phage FluMu protein Com
MSQDTEGIDCPKCKRFIPFSRLRDDLPSLPPYHECNGGNVYTSDGYNKWKCSNCGELNSIGWDTCNGCGKYKDSNHYLRSADPNDKSDNQRFHTKPGHNRIITRTEFGDGYVIER